jgi:hypothetical protein
VRRAVPRGVDNWYTVAGNRRIDSSVSEESAVLYWIIMRIQDSSRQGAPHRYRLTLWYILFVCSLSAADDGWAAQTWTRWEESLLSTRDYENPYQEVVLRVSYRGPDQQRITGLGFWDGGNTFKIRAMFPIPGRWTWESACSDIGNAGLHHQTGSVDEVEYSGENPLFRHGYFKIAANHRHLAHADGTPFLWIGDTAWATPMNTPWEDWLSYVKDRVAKNFTVLQVFCASDWAGTNDWRGHSPFVGDGLTRINPAYWQQYEQKVQYANERGLSVAVVGLMEPVKRYPDAVSAQRFAQHLTARLMGNFVMFSPSFDSVYKELGDTVGQTVRESTSVSLITQHPGTDLPAAQTYHAKPYVDFCGLQSGAGWGGKPLSAETVARNAVEWSLDLYRRQPPKPVINLEARYDSDFNDKQMPRLPRSCGYWSLLSGCAGYTYGCAGIWNWGIRVTHDDPQETVRDWRTGLSKPSSTEMKHLAKAFAGIPWWTLEPHPELILNQSSDWTRHMVLAKSRNGDLAVAYLPDNESLELDASTCAASASALWFDPRSGESHAGAMSTNSGSMRFLRPTGWEDALLILRSGQP